MGLSSRNSLCRRISRGADARAQFVESHINKGLAYQLRAMREAREWSQEQLADLVGMPQTAISRLESSNYGKPTITTLKRMAKVYDVGLVVRFVPFSQLVDWVSGTLFLDMGVSSDSVNVPSFEEEEQRGAFNARVNTTVPIHRFQVKTTFVWSESVWYEQAREPAAPSFVIAARGNVAPPNIQLYRTESSPVLPPATTPRDLCIFGLMSQEQEQNIWRDARA